MTPEIRFRWKSNLAGAGIQVDEETLERVEPSVTERLDGLRGALERLEDRAMNPDYLRETVVEERAGGDA